MEGGKLEERKPLPEDFRYASDTNSALADPEELYTLVEGCSPGAFRWSTQRQQRLRVNDLMRVRPFANAVSCWPYMAARLCARLCCRMDTSRIDEADIQAVVETLRSDWLTTGPKVAEFEEAFAAWVGAKYAVSFSSGTAALAWRRLCSRIGAGRRSHHFAADFCRDGELRSLSGCQAGICRCLPDTLNLDPRACAHTLTSRTKAILPVDYAGHPADLDPFLELAETARADHHRGCMPRPGRRIPWKNVLAALRT